MVSRLRIFALGIACTLSAQVGMDVTFNPLNTVFFFDLHDVVLKPDTGKRIKLALKNPLSTLGLLFPFRKGSKVTIRNGEEYMLRLKEKGLNSQAELVRKFSAAYEVKTDVFEIILALKEKGYRVCMASNIGKHNLDDLLSPRHPKNGKKLSRVKISDVIDTFDDLIFVDYQSQNVIAKPSPRYFEIVQNRCGHDKRVIFVDDNKKNILAAQECGLHSIRFTSAKKLNKELQTLNIL
jgi:FMN phosphatase YigB (HAD superfamily)